MGRGGLYFRQTLPSYDGQQTPTGTPTDQSSIQFQGTETASISQMVDSSSTALLEEISSKARKPPIWPWVLGLGVAVQAALATVAAPVWTYCVSLPICGLGLLLAIHADKLRKTVVLCYELAPHIEEAYENLHNAFGLLQGCSRVWHIASTGRITTTYDWKVNAGASQIVRRQGINPHLGAPPYFQCNVSIPVLPGGRQCLYFLPDRVLVWGSDGVGAVGFDEIEVCIRDTRFIESGTVPSDARVVDKTWNYVNKKGGPDRRFANNREIPIALYEEMLFTSKSGLQELFQLSRTGIATDIRSAMSRMASAIALPEAVESETGYIKCPCNNCDVFIEFPAHGVGQTIKCPHCGLETTLFKPSS
jgi:hypothetical protein